MAADSEEPSDAEVIRGAIASKLLDLHTCMPGRVEAYDKVTQTADVVPVVRRPLQREDGEVTHSQYPVIKNVPVGWMFAGGIWMQMPLAKGDSVWLMFSETAFAQWRATGEISDPGDLRRHDLSYPVALPIHIRTALPPINDGEAVIDGGILRVGGGPLGVGADFVALSTKVLAELAAIKAVFDTHTHVTTATVGATATPGVLSTPATPFPTPGSVAASKLKSE